MNNIDKLSGFKFFSARLFYDRLQYKYILIRKLVQKTYSLPAVDFVHVSEVVSIRGSVSNGYRQGWNPPADETSETEPETS